MQKQATATAEGWLGFYFPTHRDEAAMDGAPERLCLFEENKAGPPAARKDDIFYGLG